MSSKGLFLFAFAAILSTAALAAEESATSPTCCIKHAYCCSIKSPCCGKTIELEVVR